MLLSWQIKARAIEAVGKCIGPTMQHVAQRYRRLQANERDAIRQYYHGGGDNVVVRQICRNHRIRR
ncbi:MAG: hypothetical protein ACYST6_09445 [Planctomycetota bacterium]|jgi:hypothetical protein